MALLLMAVPLVVMFESVELLVYSLSLWCLSWMQPSPFSVMFLAELLDKLRSTLAIELAELMDLSSMLRLLVVPAARDTMLYSTMKVPCNVHDKFSLNT